MALTWLSRSATCLVLLVVLAIRACSSASSRPLLGDVEYYSMVERHVQWMAQFGREYTDATEKEKRFNVFKENVKRIEEFNKAGNQLYRLSVNEFADLTNEEFVAARNGYKGLCLEAKVPSSFKYENVSAVPSNMDWRKKGCCWAFSAVAATEGIHQLKTGKLISLSEQELVDCDTKGVDQGCNGGLMDDAFKFIMSNKGLNTETNYPYKAADTTCNAKEASTHAAQITGFEDVPANSEAALLKAVAKQPVSVAIEASGFGFQFYSSGVFTGPCGTQLDHGVKF